jgi:predicted Fe-S protein YdhL (DUF1289 family)
VTAVPSPCINVCRMDEATGWCAGCLRTLDEIAAWSTLEDAAKRAVLGTIVQRKIEWRRRRAERAAGAEVPR